MHIPRHACVIDVHLVSSGVEHLAAVAHRGGRSLSVAAGADTHTWLYCCWQQWWQQQWWQQRQQQ